MDTDINQKEESYYSELQHGARNYDTKLWAIPGIFFLLQATIFDAIHWETFFTWSNGTILFADGIFSILLWIQFVKDRMWQLLVQKKIDAKDREYNEGKLEDKKRIPLYAIRKENKKRMIEEFAKVYTETDLPCRFFCVVNIHLSRCVERVMLLWSIILILLPLIILGITLFKLFAI